MKLKFFFSLLFIAAFSLTVAAQSVVITPKKVTYTRPEPMSDFKKTFTVRFPKVKAATKALSRKIETTISFEKVLNLNIAEEKTEIQWLEEADYEVDYNKDGILVVTLSMSGSGAYPSVASETVTVNLKTGNRVSPADVFINLKGLAAMVKQAQDIEVKEAIEEIKKDENYDDEDFDPKQFFETTDFTIKDLKEFSIDDKGVTFIYDYGFPHVALALEPAGNFRYTWAELKPFIKRGGLLAKFVR